MNEASTFDLRRIRDESFVHEIDFHWQTDSTNSLALKRAEHDDFQSPLLVLAEQQTCGRGRGKNQWWSAPGALTFSLIVPLDGIENERLPRIALTTGLAVCQAVEQLAPNSDLGLKWPNDVFLNGRKLAGVLIELPPCRPPLAVIGIGVNVNNSMQLAEPQLRETAISMIDATQAQWDRSDVLIACLKQLEQRLSELRNRSNNLVEQWRAYHILHGKSLRVDLYDRQLDGTCVGIDDDGALLLETSRGIERLLGGVITAFDLGHPCPRADSRPSDTEGER